MTLYKNITHKKIVIGLMLILISISISSCRLPDSFGFYQPFTLRLKTPDGPPAYKAGWYGGCKSGLANRAFNNAVVYQDGKGPEFVNGVYMHDPDYQTGWGQGWFHCVMHAAYFAGSPGFYSYGPLE